MDDLVRASGLSKGSLYWHFDSKRDVFLALFDRFAQEIFGAWASLEAAGGGSLETLRRFGEVAIEVIASRPGLLGAWAEFVAHPEVRRRLAGVYSESRREVARVLEDGMARGELRELPAQAVAAALVAHVEGLLVQALVDPAFDPRAHYPAAWTLLARGLEP
jgi:AcrR family transcriptional regulator